MQSNKQHNKSYTSWEGNSIVKVDDSYDMVKTELNMTVERRIDTEKQLEYKSCKQ